MPVSFRIRIWRFLAGLRRPSQRRNARRLRARSERLDSLKIREATAADIAAVARFHVDMWNWTYAPFFEAGPSYEVRERQWRNAFAARDPGWFCLVMERADGQIVGLAQANLSDNPEFGGELRKIYLLPEYQRLGLGRQLVCRVARHFLSIGIDSMWLYGDARNPSIKAWLALGAEKTDNDPRNGNYGWRDLRNAEARLCGVIDSV